MSRLVVASNRVPAAGAGASAGGLAVALKAALAERGGLWFGWSGEICEEGARDCLHTLQDGKIAYLLLDLCERDVDEYYRGFANRTLWPLFHYRLDLAGFSRETRAGYYRVNDLFARTLAPHLSPDDIVWVHDYHLIPLGAALRGLGLQNRIGFFLHIPWPPADLFLALPGHRDLLKALSAYDLVGFQTEQDLENCIGCLVREGLARRVGGHPVDETGKPLRFGVFPIGIETQEFAETAVRAERNSIVRRMHASLADRDLIIGVDRLDYSKGIAERMKAFGRFIELHPDQRNKVTYLQVTPKSRSEVPAYAAMQREVAEIVGRINGNYGELDWTPIRYLNRSIARSSLAGLFRLSQVGLVTPLRDGMNLVSKEYVAAQNPVDPGVLVLSRFAGAANELDGALIVNPYDIDQTANAIAAAVAMPLDERISRWRGMFTRLRRHDAAHWRDLFLRRLTASGKESRPVAVVS
jgi:trehalose 6-phosphate synthase